MSVLQHISFNNYATCLAKTINGRSVVDTCGMMWDLIQDGADVAFACL